MTSIVTVSQNTWSSEMVVATGQSPRRALPLSQKEGYIVLWETYLKTRDDYRDSNCIIQN